jgi:hypothetical protein
MKERMREKRITDRGEPVHMSYHDPGGWVGWSAADLTPQQGRIPVDSSVDTYVAAMDHVAAAEITKAFARAAHEIRAEVQG